MSRKLYVTGNWKMNTSCAEATALAKALVAELGGFDAVDVAVSPPMVYLGAVGRALAGSNVAMGAQNMYHQSNGAFTGETSGEMLKDVGCSFVILGHSERRHVMGENDELIALKVVKALADGLDVILCVGETLDERKAEQTMDVVARQVKLCLADVAKDNANRITVAYEPVWAIGTGLTATPEQAQEVHAVIRGLLGEAYGCDIAQTMRIQYGGSVKPSNAAELLGCEDIDGALVGGAALKGDDFAAIARACV